MDNIRQKTIKLVMKMIQKCTFEKGYFGRSYRKHAKIHRQIMGLKYPKYTKDCCKEKSAYIPLTFPAPLTNPVFPTLFLNAP